MVLNVRNLVYLIAVTADVVAIFNATTSRLPWSPLSPSHESNQMCVRQATDQLTLYVSRVAAYVC